MQTGKVKHKLLAVTAVAVPVLGATYAHGDAFTYDTSISSSATTFSYDNTSPDWNDTYTGTISPPGATVTLAFHAAQDANYYAYSWNSSNPGFDPDGTYPGYGTPNLGDPGYEDTAGNIPSADIASYGPQRTDFVLGGLYELLKLATPLTAGQSYTTPAEPFALTITDSGTGNTATLTGTITGSFSLPSTQSHFTLTEAFNQPSFVLDGNTYDLYNSLTKSDQSTFSITTNNSNPSQQAHSIEIDAIPVPEPTVVGLLAIGSLSFLGRRSRRRGL